MAQVQQVKVPLITKLETWGYEDKFEVPLVQTIKDLDTHSLALVEKLVDDLSRVNDISCNLRTKFAIIKEKVHHEKARLEQLVCDNQKLLEENGRLSRDLDALRRLPCNGEDQKECRVDEQVQQWRAQSMHQLQELENMNQALRSTLNLHSCCPENDQKGCKGNESVHPKSTLPSISMSGVVGPRCMSPRNSKSKLKTTRQKTIELVKVAEMRCKKLEEELHVLKQRHSLLEHKLEGHEKALPNKGKTQPSAIAKLPNVDVGVGTDHLQPQPEHFGDCAQNDISRAPNQCEQLTADFLSLLQAYERELTALVSAHVSDAEALKRQTGTSNKQTSNGFRGHQEECDQGVQDFLHDLESKGKYQGISALCMDGNYPMLPEAPTQRMTAARADLEQKWFSFDQKIIQMVTSVKAFKAQNTSKVEGLKEKMEELHSILVSQESVIATLRSDVLKKADQINFILDEKVVGEEALQASQQECNELASLIREIDGSMVQLTTALATRTMERDQEAEARMNSEEEVRRKYNNLVSEFDGTQAQVSKLQLELDQTKRQQNNDRCRTGGLNSELQHCMNRMEDAEQDVEQLKTLVIQLDATREDLVGKLNSAMQNEKVAETQVVALDIEVRRLTEEAGTCQAEVTHLCGLLDALGKERDHLQSETSMQAERICHLSEDSSKLEAEVRFLRKNLQTMDQRLQAANSLLSQAEAELLSLKEHLSMEEATKIQLEELWNAKSLEQRAAADELGNLTYEHQILRNDLVQLTTSHEGLMESLRNLTTKLNHTEQVLFSKEKDQEQLLNIHQKMCNENQQLKQAGFELENQLQHQGYHLQGVEEMFHKAQEQARSLEEEFQLRVSELKAMERQADLMTRSLNQQSALLNDYQNEKAALMAQLSAAKMAVTELDAKLDSALREIVGLQGKNQHISEHVQENMKEAERLTASWKLEQQRVRELENLLACVRAEEQQLEMASKGSIEQNLMMREHILALEEQVKTLKHTRDAQNQEIMRLQMSRTRSEGEESRRFWSAGPSSSYSTQSVDAHQHQIVKDVACSKAKILELEMKIMAMTTDLSKTTVLYKDCFSKLQNAESQSLELKKEFDHVLTLLSKVDEERTRLQHQCAELERASLKHQQLSGHSSPTKSTHPEIEKMQQECHRLKKEAASQDSDSNVVARIA